MKFADPSHPSPSQFVFSGVMYIIGLLLLPETYAPTLLRARAAALQKASAENGGQTIYYVSKYDLNRKSAGEIMRVNLTRPFVLLFMEPIVLLFSIYSKFSESRLTLTVVLS